MPGLDSGFFPDLFQVGLFAGRQYLHCFNQFCGCVPLLVAIMRQFAPHHPIFIQDKQNRVWEETRRFLVPHAPGVYCPGFGVGK